MWSSEGIFVRTYAPYTGDSSPMLAFDAPSDNPYDGASGGTQGLRCAVKDNIAVKDAPLTFGLSPPLIAKNAEDAEIVATLRNAGHTLVGSTVLDEACLEAAGWNPHWGLTPNPRYPHHITLGSSSGSAAAVAANLVDIAVGTDFIGSVRAPAAACGIVGYRPTSSRLPRGGAYLYHPTMDSIGLLANDVTTIERFLTTTSHDKSTVPHPPDCHVPVLALGNFESSALSQLDALRIHIQQTPPWSWEQIRDCGKILCAEAAAKAFREWKLPSSRWTDTMQALVTFFDSCPQHAHRQAHATARTLASQLTEYLNQYPLIIFPALFGAVPLRSKSGGSPVLPDDLLWPLTIASICDCPSIVMPLANPTVPQAIQIVSKPGLDHAVLSYAKFLQEAAK